MSNVTVAAGSEYESARRRHDPRGGAGRKATSATSAQHRPPHRWWRPRQSGRRPGPRLRGVGAARRPRCRPMPSDGHLQVEVQPLRPSPTIARSTATYGPRARTAVWRHRFGPGGSLPAQHHRDPSSVRLDDLATIVGRVGHDQARPEGSRVLVLDGTMALMSTTAPSSDPLAEVQLLHRSASTRPDYLGRLPQHRYEFEMLEPGGAVVGFGADVDRARGRRPRRDRPGGRAVLGPGRLSGRSTTKRSTSRAIPANASSSTAPNQRARHSKPSTCSPAGRAPRCPPFRTSGSCSGEVAPGPPAVEPRAHHGADGLQQQATRRPDVGHHAIPVLR